MRTTDTLVPDVFHSDHDDDSVDDDDDDDDNNDNNDDNADDGVHIGDDESVNEVHSVASDHAALLSARGRHDSGNDDDDDNDDYDDDDDDADANDSGGHDESDRSSCEWEGGGVDVRRRISDLFADVLSCR
jgi:hypothetical protein